VRRGELNFERLCEVLSTRGYVTDLEQEPGLSFNRPSVNHAHQDDFNALFKVLMPGRINDIKFMTISTPWNSQSGSTYAVFNSALIDRNVMEGMLIELNGESIQDL